MRYLPVTLVLLLVNCGPADPPPNDSDAPAAKLSADELIGKAKKAFAKGYDSGIGYCAQAGTPAALELLLAEVPRTTDWSGGWVSQEKLVKALAAWPDQQTRVEQTLLAWSATIEGAALPSIARVFAERGKGDGLLQVCRRLADNTFTMPMTKLIEQLAAAKPAGTADLVAELLRMDPATGAHSDSSQRPLQGARSMMPTGPPSGLRLSSSKMPIPARPFLARSRATTGAFFFRVWRRGPSSSAFRSRASCRPRSRSSYRR